LLRKWRRFDSADPRTKRTYWALALTATLLINAYAMMYDAILVVAAFLLVYDVASRTSFPWQLRALQITGGLLYGSSIFAFSVVNWTHVQPFTVALVLFGIWLWRMTGKRDECTRHTGGVS
jgi:hypothetical protein